MGLERQNRQSLVEKYNDLIVKANAIRADNQLLVQAVREREQWITQCSIRNQKLQTTTLELLDKYREKGLLEQLGELEILTGLGQIAAETTVEDYKYQLKQLKITPFKPADNRIEAKSLPAAEDAAKLPIAAEEASINNTNVSNALNAEANAERSAGSKEATISPALKP